MAVNSVSSSSRIELLSKENFDTWSMQVEALLIKNDLWDYVNGTCAMPTECDAAAKALWLKNDKKAKADLVLSIQPSELKQVRGCDTSRDVWLKLESIYASKGPARKATLLKQLMLQKLDEGGNVKEHIATFFDAVDKLESLSVPINGDLLSIMLLYSLPSSYENFRCAIESRDELPKADILKIKIIEESEARKQASGSAVIAMAAGERIHAHKKFTKSKDKFTPKHNFKCFKCGAFGHKASACKARKGDSANRGKQQDQEVNESYAACYTAAEHIWRSEHSFRSKHDWILDSGCTAHLCGDISNFSSIDKSTKVKLNLASQACAEVRGKGKVKLAVAGYGGEQLIEFNNTLFVPDLRTNLISVAKITNKGHTVTFVKNGAYVSDENGKTILVADRKGDLFFVREGNECAIAEVRCSELFKWHCRLGHLNSKDLVRLVNQGALPKMDVSESRELSNCETCLKSKMTALSFDKSREHCKELLKIVHSDVVGPFREESIGRARYFVTFIDDSSRWCEVYFLRQKSDVFTAFKLYQTCIERQTGQKIKCLQSDNGREYCNNIFDQYLSDNGILRRLSIPNTPEQNGLAERMNRTLLDMSRCLLSQSGLGKSFWAEAVATSAYIRNRCPSSSINWKTPYEKLNGDQPLLNHMKVFGSKVMVLDKDPGKNKLAPRAIEGIFVGYPRDRKGYRIWVPNTHQIVYARDVKFLEMNLPRSPHTVVVDELLLSDKEENVDNDERGIVEFSPPKLQGDNSANTEGDSVKNVAPVNDINQIRNRAPGRPRLLRGHRGRPRKLFHSRNLEEASQDSDPPDVQADELSDDVFTGIAEIETRSALKDPDRDEWKDAIESEVISILKNDTFKIVKTGDNKNIIGCRFVLTNKYGNEGKIERRKARLVAKGYSQKYRVNYSETFAPVARLETVRLMLALAIHFNFKIWQFDVVTAYLNGPLDEDVFMKVPDMLPEILKRIVSKRSDNCPISTCAGSMLTNLHNGGNACKLNKALYGLKQSGRQWYIKLRTKLSEMGLEPLKNEPCLFSGIICDEFCLLLVYVDDLLISAKSLKCIEYVKKQLLQEFEIKDMGQAKYCLGLEISQSANYIALRQTGYVMNLLRQYGMEDCNPVMTPSEVNVKFPDSKKLSEVNHYRELIGSLMYLSVATRPDIANTVSRLAQYVTNPSMCHWLAAKRVLRYLAGSPHRGLVFRKTNDPLIGYADADWGGCTVDRRSYTGYVFLISGAAITWKSQKQRTVALSSTEAEYISLAEATKEAIYLRSLLTELGLREFIDITIFVDNKGAQCLAGDPVFHARTKHIDIKHHFIRETVAAGHLKLQHISTQNMVADVMTKSLSKVNHERCRTGLGLTT